MSLTRKFQGSALEIGGMKTIFITILKSGDVKEK